MNNNKRGNYSQKKITCRKCGNEKLLFLGIVNTGEKIIEVGLPSLLKITYKKNVNHVNYRCLSCNDVSAKKLEILK